MYASANTQVHTLRRIVREKDQTIRRQSQLTDQPGGLAAHQPMRGEGDGGVAESGCPSPPPCLTLSSR